MTLSRSAAMELVEPTQMMLAPVCSGFDAVGEGLAGEEVGPDIEREGAVEEVLGQLAEGGVEEGAGIVDQRIELAPLRMRRLDQRLAAAGLG